MNKITLGLMMLVAMASCNTQTENANTAHKVEPPKENIALAGKKLKYNYGDTVYEINFKSENQLHWHCIEGEEKGRQANETYSSLRLNEHTHFVSWVEEDGLGVSQVIDLKNYTINCFLKIDKDIIPLTGTIHEL